MIRAEIDAHGGHITFSDSCASRDLQTVTIRSIEERHQQRSRPRSADPLDAGVQGTGEVERWAVVESTILDSDQVALMDALAVPNVCGSDVQKTSNYSISPIRLVWMQACADDLAAVPPLPSYRTQKTPNDFRQPRIRAERRLVRDDQYVPEFPRVPLQFEKITITLSAGERRVLDSMPSRNAHADDAAALRDVLLTWWATSHG